MVEYVNIMEAARLLGVSDKTIRRWIHAHRLPARFPQSNRCEIAISDLEPFSPGHVSGQKKEPLESRIAALESQVQTLEWQVQQLLMRSATVATRTSPRRPRERTAGSLPAHLVFALAFAELHRIPEQKVLTHVTMDIPLLKAVRGEWTDADGIVVTLALDAKGRQAFYQLYHESPWFAPCTRCPHTLPGHV